MNRQKIVGWVLIGASILYIVYFLKGRLLSPGGPILTKEWVWFSLSFVGIMLGTINIRMAEMRERKQRTLPLVDPDRVQRK